MKLHASDHKVDLLFVLALFTTFVATAFLVVLIGARQYQVTADNMNYNYEVRTASSYIEEKLRQSDAGDAILVSAISDGDTTVDALILYETLGEDSYCTYIYYYNGYLRELYAKENAKFSLSAGQALLETSSFTPSIVNKHLVKVTFTGTDQVEYPIYVAIHSGCGKEDK